MKKLLFVTLFVYVAFLSPILANANDLPILEEVHQKINEEFQRLDAAMKDAAHKLSISGLTGDGARSSLAGLCGNFTFAIDCTAVDPKGKMVTLEPSAFRHLEGTDISAQEQVKRVIKNHKPVMNSVFKAVEGFDAVDQEFACSMLISRRIYPDAPSHSLQSIIQYREIQTNGVFHRALADAEMTALLWINMINDLKEVYHLGCVPFELLLRISRMNKALVPKYLERVAEECAG